MCARAHTHMHIQTHKFRYEEIYFQASGCVDKHGDLLQSERLELGTGC